MSPKVLPSGCGVCGKQQDLFRCGGCKVRRYCSREHQAEHWQLHKSPCNDVRRSRVSMEKKEQALINHPGDTFMDPAPFVNSVGDFWGIPQTRPYTQARASLANSMVSIDTVESAEAQLEHFMDMLRLCRNDNLGVRDIIPGLMLRLNKDQECCDFIKWWADADEWSAKNWNKKHADAFEPVDGSNNFYDLCHSVCLIALKIKLLLDLMRLQGSAFCLGTKVPREIVDVIQTSVPPSPIFRANPQLMHEGAGPFGSS